MKLRFKKIVALIIIVCMASTGLSYAPMVKGDSVVENDTEFDVLFIGNSMTYYNNLHKMVEGIASKRGHDINCSAVTEGGRNLVYHSKNDNVMTALKKGGFEVVVLQDIVGSFDGDNLETGAGALESIIKQYNPNARIIFYEPWPTKNTILGEESLLPYFTYNYIKTSKKLGAGLAPAGEAFYELYNDNELDFYCTDKKHPKPLGTFVSASSIYYAIYSDEERVEYSSDDQNYIDTLINDNVAYTSEGVQDTYDVNTINLIDKLSYEYVHAVMPAVTLGSKYTSVAGDYVDIDAILNPDDLKATNGNVVNSSLFSKANGNMAVDCNAYASNEKQSASYGVNGKNNDRWETEYSEPHWFYVDLGAEKEVSKVGFIWEGAYAAKYYIQLSNDASNWNTVAAVRATSAKTVQIDLGKTYNARYVRMYATKRGTGYGFSFYEMGVWNNNEVVTTTNVTGSTEKPSLKNVINDRRRYAYMTSNANNKTEGFCYIGNGFSDINCCNENLGNGNNMLGTTATTGEVALYVDFGNDYSISNALIYQGSTNNKFYDSYCTNYKIYYSLEEVNKTNNGNVCWKLAGQCNNGTIYNGANIKIKSASNRSSEGDKIIFEEEHVARSIKIVFDKNSCKGTGINGNNSGTIGTVSLLSVRVYGTEYKGTKYNVVIDDEIMDVVAEGENYSLGDVKYGYYSNGIMYPAGYSFAVNKDIEFTSVNDLSITMQEGAGIKLSVPTGLRFMASISSDNMKLIADESAITSGMLITTADNYRNNNMLLDLASTYNMINVINRGWYDKDGDGNTYMSDVGKYCGSIVNIRNSNYDREFISRAYVTINYIDGTKMTIYSNMSVKRSVRFVAEAVRTNGYQGLILEQIGVIDSIIKTD